MLRFFKIFPNISAGLMAATLSCALFLAGPSAATAADDNKSVGGKPGPAETAAPPASVAKPALKFDVKVSTGSGSASNSPDAVPVPLAPAPAVEAKAPEAASADTPAASKAEAVPAPQTPMAPEAPLTPAESADTLLTPERRAIFAALDTWHTENLKNYNYNIAGLYDPFMPIKEVRGKPEELDALDPEEEAKLPPILKLELSQLKLVAITSVTGRSDASLASFEDGAGSSYILRQSDRIGRRQGRIVRIEPTQVIVEEAPRGSSKEPLITVIKLNALDNSGLTYSNGG